MASIYGFRCDYCLKFTALNDHQLKELIWWVCEHCGYTSTIEESLNMSKKPTREYAERKNDGKPQMSYVDLHCLAPAAAVLEFGAKKYSRNNWKKGMPVSKILDSLMRHIADLQDGKVLDDDSKLAIIGHIQCNAMFLGNKNNEDDITPDSSLYK